MNDWSTMHRERPVRGIRSILPVDITVTGDPRNGVVDVHADPGGNDPLVTLCLTVDLLAVLHAKAGTKLEQLRGAHV